MIVQEADAAALRFMSGDLTASEWSERLGIDPSVIAEFCAGERLPLRRESRYDSRGGSILRDLGLYGASRLSSLAGWLKMDPADILAEVRKLLATGAVQISDPNAADPMIWRT